MKDKKFNLFQTILRIVVAFAIAHFVYYILITELFNKSEGFEGLRFITPIRIAFAVVLFIALKLLTRLRVITIILGMVLAYGISYLIGRLLHPELFSGDGSTLQSVNLFVPNLMWDNDFEYLRIFPTTYIISVVFNYALIIVSILVSKRLYMNDRPNIHF